VTRATFPGGIHPPEYKWTADSAIRTLPAPPRLVVPMAQNLGAPAVPLVEKGQAVARGEPIGKPDGFISARVHAPTSGTVTALERVTDAATGRRTTAVVIEADGEDRPHADLPDGPRDWRAMDAEAIREAVAAAGVVGMGGATFPTHVKLTPPEGKPVDTVLINGAECEPFLTCDYRVMLEAAERVAVGLRLCMRATGAERGWVCIEDNKPAAAEAMRQALADVDGCEVRVFPTKYPQGAEKQLILAATGREVPTGGLPADAGVVVQNVQTAVAIADACERGLPLIERVLTITGDTVAEPCNVRARIGTPIGPLLADAGVEDGFAELILGGPMMGKAQFTTDLSVLKGTSGLIVFRRPAMYEGGPCIRCGACVRHCPSYLNPSRLSILAESFLDGNLDAVDQAMEFGLMDCILCGTCAYVCPSRRRMVHLIDMLRGERRKALERQRARERAQTADLQRQSEQVED